MANLGKSSKPTFSQPDSDWVDVDDSSDWVDVDPPKAQSRPIESAIEGFGQAATMGYLPSIQGAISGLIDPGKKENENLRSKGFSVDDKGEGEIAQRDYFVNRQKGLRDSNPYSYIGGEVGGAISTGIASGAGAGLLGKSAPGIAGIVSKAPTVSRIAAGAAGGATQAAAMNPGYEEGKPLEFQADKRIDNATSGAVLGAAVPAIGAIAKGISKIPSSISKGTAAAEQTMRLASAGAIQKDLNSLTKPMQKEMADYIRSSKIAPPGASVEDVLKRSDVKIDQVGKKLSRIYDQASTSPASQLPTKEVMDLFDIRVRDALKKANYDVTGEEALSNLSPYFEKIAKAETINPKQLHRLRMELDKVERTAAAVRKTAGAKDISSQEVATFGIRNAINEVLQDIAAKTGGKEGASLAKYNKEFSILSNINKISNSAVNRSAGNRIVSPSDYAAGIGSAIASTAATANPMTGLLVGGGGLIANKMARKYGAAVTAPALGGISKASGLVSKVSDYAGGIIDSARKSPASTAAGLIRFRGRKDEKKK